MELFGIVLSVPAGLLLSLGYCALLVTVVRRREAWRRGLRWGGIVVLGLLAIELALLAAFGANGSARLLGPAFYVGHLMIFFLGAPALGNVLVLAKREWLFGRWYVAAMACTTLILGLVLLQYGVSEALFGID